MLSKTRSSSASSSTAKTIGQHLDGLKNSNQALFRSFIVGRKDYDPHEGDGGVNYWEKLERQAAVGMRGTLHENFVPSVQVLDGSTDNVEMPVTVVNGTCNCGERGGALNLWVKCNFII